MKIAIITSCRADFGLLKNLIINLKKDKKFKTYLIVTGSHFSKRNGLSINEIKKTKIKIDKKIILQNKSNNSDNINTDFSDLVRYSSKFFKQKKIELFIVLGDRYEVLASVVAAYLSRIAIGHIHGGEITSGSMDDSMRHAITKLSNYHFVSCGDYKKRVLQLGEKKENIYNVGGLGAENIKRINFLTRADIEKLLKIQLKEKIIIVNLNPETTSFEQTKTLLKETFLALEKIKNKTIIFTLPSLDLDSNFIHKEVKKFAKDRVNFFVFKTLGSEIFYSLLNISEMMIGNSSSGLLEMPSFKKPTINIGKRQKGRIEAMSVISVPSCRKKIGIAIRRASSSKFKKFCKTCVNPYEKKNTSLNIVNILRRLKIKKNKLKYKEFQDII